MNELQAVELNLYIEFKKICDRHNLLFFAIGGTCIGAVRHKGFIPWDDDIDVAMPINDYKRFIEVAENELPSNIKLYLIEDHPHWFRNFIKIHDVSTTFAETDSLDYTDRFTGVYMDIMPVYGLPQGRLRQFLYSLINDYYQYMNRRHRIPYSNRRHFIDRIAKILSLKYGKRRKDLNLYIDQIDRTFGRFFFSNSDKILFGWRDRIENAHSAFHYKTVFDYRDFKSTIDVPFESTTMRIPIGYDHYLTTEFGDYMQLPPEEKRITHNTAIVDLKKSYLDYIRGNNVKKEGE